MPKLTKIYTRTGDDGSTALGNRQRVLKDSARIKAYGSVDELNAAIGLALSFGLATHVSNILSRIQNELFHLGSELAFPESDQKRPDIPEIHSKHIQALESTIDELNQQVGPLENFILPGGSQGAAALHVARTICRRTERDLVSLSLQEQVSPQSLAYLNRLSDVLFVIARFENKHSGVDEPVWDSRA